MVLLFIVPALGGHLSGLIDPEKPMWDEYLRIRNIAEPLENEAADEFISPELMTRLRAAPFEKGSGYARLGRPCPPGYRRGNSRSPSR